MGNASFLSVAFEVILVVGALLVLLVAVVFDRNRKVWAPIAGGSFLLAALSGLLQWRAVADGEGGLFFSAQGLQIFKSPMVVMDGFSAFAAIVLGLVGFAAMLGSWDLVSKVGKRSAEFVALSLLAFSGLHMMAASPNLVVIFVGLETASISFYILAGFVRGDVRSDEAALKYFLLGSLASALFLYGVALTFAATGSLTIYGANSIRDFFSTTVVTKPGILLVGMALMLVGLLFKISAAPFHQWAPDVYQGAPSGAVGLMAAGVKVAGFAALGRIFVGGLISQIDTWGPIVAVIAALSMLVGTTMALVQTDMKRLVAYSGVAHSGYLLLTLLAGVDGMPAMWFYLATYPFMIVGTFAVISTVSGPSSTSSPIAAMRGLAHRSPEIGWLLAILMFGMAGMPFFAGFVGKILAFVAAGEVGYIWLVVVATLTTVIGFAFYLKVVGAVFSSEEDSASSIEPTLSARFAVVIGASVTVVFGIVPWILMDVVRDAFPI
ncbi:MAG: NADH-quinone oxidoreductase subunit N [Acidimicrobiia bacterium]